MNEIKAVIFDLGRVLIDVDADSLNRLFGLESLDGDSAMNTYISNDLIRSFENGSVDPHYFHRQVFGQSADGIGYEDFVDRYCGVFSAIGGAPDLVARVSQNLPVGLLSDTNALHWPCILEQFPWLSIFEKPTLSFQTGILKPAPKAYQTAANSVGIDITNCLFIDDLERNVKGAIDAGMMAIRFESVEKLTAQLSQFRGVLI